MAKLSRRRIAVADRSKFGIVAGWRIGETSDPNMLITDSQATDAIHTSIAARLGPPSLCVRKTETSCLWIVKGRNALLKPNSGQIIPTNYFARAQE